MSRYEQVWWLRYALLCSMHLVLSAELQCYCDCCMWFINLDTIISYHINGVYVYMYLWPYHLCDPHSTGRIGSVVQGWEGWGQLCYQ